MRLVQRATDSWRSLSYAWSRGYFWGNNRVRTFADESTASLSKENVSDSHEEEKKMTEGVKSILHRLLAEAQEPLNSDELWNLAEKEGLRSKTFMKKMCQQMRKRGHIKTRPIGGGKNRRHGYFLPGSAADPKEAKEKLSMHTLAAASILKEDCSPSSQWEQPR